MFGDILGGGLSKSILGMVEIGDVVRYVSDSAIPGVDEGQVVPAMVTVIYTGTGADGSRVVQCDLTIFAPGAIFWRNKVTHSKSKEPGTWHFNGD